MKDKRLGELADQYEELINHGNPTWIDNDFNIPLSTAYFLDRFFELGIKVELCNSTLGQDIGGYYVFRINDPKIRYFVHVPELNVHMYADEGFHNALPMNECLAYLAELAGICTTDVANKVFKKVDQMLSSPENN